MLSGWHTLIAVSFVAALLLPASVPAQSLLDLSAYCAKEYRQDEESGTAAPIDWLPGGDPLLSCVEESGGESLSFIVSPKEVCRFQTGSDDWFPQKPGVYCGNPPAYPHLLLQFTQPASATDSFRAFLTDLRDAVKERDIAALRAFVGESFFWDQDFGDVHDESASPFEALVSIFNLRDDSLAARRSRRSWGKLQALVDASTVMRHPDHEGVLCVPGEPNYVDEGLGHQSFVETGTDGLHDWGWIEHRPVPVEAISKPRETIALLQSEAVRVLVWHPFLIGGSPRVRVALPDGRQGGVLWTEIWSWSPARLCFSYDDEGEWKIVGYRGGGD